MVQPPSPSGRGSSSSRIEAAIRTSRRTSSGGLPVWASRIGRSIASTASGPHDERAVSWRCRWSHVVPGKSGRVRSGRGSGCPGNRARKRRCSRTLREASRLAVLVRSLQVCGWSMHLPRAALRRGRSGRGRQWGRLIGVKIAMSGQGGGEQSRRLAPGGHAQPLAGLADAHVDAGRRYAQLLGDLLGGKAARDQRQAFALSRRQASDAFGRRRGDVGHAGRLRESHDADSCGDREPGKPGRDGGTRTHTDCSNGF